MRLMSYKINKLFIAAVKFRSFRPSSGHLTLIFGTRTRSACTES